VLLPRARHLSQLPHSLGGILAAEAAIVRLHIR
jgi:hypothetical protein